MPTIDYSEVPDLRMDIRLASSESGSLVKSARSYVIDGSAKPKAFRHLLLSEVEQCQAYALSLCRWRDENLIQADIRFQPTIGTPTPAECALAKRPRSPA